MGEGAVTTIGSWEAENVTVAQVEAALSDLRRHEVRAAVRTSVVNLVTVVDDQREADAALEVVYDLGSRHPSRTVVVVVGDEGDEGIDAAVSVHAVERDGTAMSYEDVVLHVRGRARYHLDSVVEPFTVPDLPVVVWLPAHLPSPGDPLLDVAHSLVVDSRVVPEGGDVLRRISALTRRRPVNDLSWIRLAPWRSQLAGLFEGGVCCPFLHGVRTVEVAGNHGPRHLLGGWLLRRLNLRREAVILEPAEHVSIRLTAFSEGRKGTFGVRRAGPERVIESSIDIEGGPCVQQTMRIRRQWPGLSLANALTRMSGDEAYRVALDGALELS
ncbi:MAG TPA: glucose-6-phosphate dehydrogenase assembly protein OpcA [Acidimicrobiales bacterium]|nr:glucose-6-phosphate dehydrogenase assembly protein OpcA [Acidimicrobiales bacterium]